ncbi:MAG: HD-GYP domain-containing protein [Nitrospinae bacterium]|nr:HD-GYP domain-containing protein [Nitrospinota bacterium]
MIKRIKTTQLRPGMFVHDFNCEWLENPFFASQLLIQDGRMIEKIFKAGIHELYIDTARGIDLAGGMAEEQVRKEIEAEITKISKDEDEGVSLPMGEELHAAKKVHAAAKKIVTSVMHDVRMGKQVELEAVNGVVEQMVDSIFRNQGALSSLSRLKSKDEYTFFHSVNVCVLMVAFAKGLGMPRTVINRAGVGALLHDVGKMAVPQGILNKDGRLSDEEFAQMKNHVVQSRIILEKTPGISQEAVAVASQHHERFDGSGYPDKLAREEISELGRMAAVVDVYDAITSDRVYHRGLDSAEALRKMYEWSKYHFDPKMVELFIKVVGIYPVGTVVRLQSGLVGVVKEPGTENLLMPMVKVFYDKKKEGYIEPRDIDLAKPDGVSDRILGAESAQKYKINPLEFVGLI